MKSKRYAKAYNRPEPGKMNVGERKYSHVLQLLKLAGEIQDWKFEPMKLDIGPSGGRCGYTPDFMVIALDDTIELHEVKGRTVKKGKSKAWCEEDAKVKIKAAANIYPFKFVMVWPKLAGGWDVEII